MKKFKSIDKGGRSVDELRLAAFEEKSLSALNELLTFNYKEKLDDFDRVLEDPSFDHKIKHFVVMAIGYEKKEIQTAVNILLKFLNITNSPAIIASILKSLGELGEPTSIDAVSNQQLTGNVKSYANWIKQLIAFRNGISGYEFPYFNEIQFLQINYNNSKPIAIKPIDEFLFAKCLGDVSKSGLFNNVNQSFSKSLICSDVSLILFLNDNFIQHTSDHRRLFKQIQIIGAVLKHETVPSEHWRAIYFIFIQPSPNKNKSQILITTTRNGRIMYRGDLKKSENQIILFRIRAVDPINTSPIILDGYFGQNDLIFTESKVEQKVLWKNLLKPKKIARN